MRLQKLARLPAVVLASFGLLSLALSACAQTPEKSVRLEDMDLSQMNQDYGQAHKAQSVDGRPLTLGGAVYPHGVGTHARSEILIDLKGAAKTFSATVGVDDEKKGAGSVTFQVWLDGKLAKETPVLHGGDAPQSLNVDLSGAKRLGLVVTDGGDNIDSDHADWADAQIILVSATSPKPVTLGAALPEPPMVIAARNNRETAIHGPFVTGATPGHPFLYRIPATGERPLTFSAENLPAGLTLDSKTGIISGALQSAGRIQVKLTARGPRGAGRRTLTIVSGKRKLARTPPMGWNSWNIFYTSVDEPKVRIAAEWMVKTGLADHGYQYINIDDAWEGKRDADGKILTNEKFPDMKRLGDYVHSLGLRFGVYSSPGPKTCGGYEASYQHEQQDADSYAAWGVDYLKYDWCSYEGVATGTGLERLQKPYRVMGDALDKTNRDIIYSFCQYGMGDVWKWGAETGGNLWRTTGDIGPSYNSMASIGFGQNGHEAYAGPGHWNDPDMLFMHALKPNEQITHLSLWSLLAAPLLIGSDLSKVTPFTLDALSNDEVIAVDQDPLGKAASRRWQEGSLEVWARPLWDGTTAVGLFNRGIERMPVTARWSDIGVTGAQPVRDLWQQKDVGVHTDTFTVMVPAHGAALVKVGKARDME